MLAPDDSRHGTVNAYCNLACRCSSCRRANTVSQRAYIAVIRAHTRIVGQHGTSSAYNCGCRSGLCTTANTERSQALPPHPSRRITLAHIAFAWIVVQVTVIGHSLGRRQRDSKQTEPDEEYHGESDLSNEHSWSPCLRCGGGVVAAYPSVKTVSLSEGRHFRERDVGFVGDEHFGGQEHRRNRRRIFQR